MLRCRYAFSNICNHTVALWKMNVNKNLSNFNKILLIVDNNVSELTSDEDHGLIIDVLTEYLVQC